MNAAHRVWTLDAEATAQARPRLGEILIDCVRDGSASHLYLLSYLEGDRYCAEGALVLLGRASRAAPPVRFELLEAAAKQLRRLRVASA